MLGSLPEDGSKSPSASSPFRNEPGYEAQRGQNAPLVGKTVVIVEDEGITMMQLRRTLTQVGLKVVGVAGNGEAGAATVLRERPDVVIMDIKMPVMNGIEAARRILETYAVCIVMLTAFSTEEFQEQAREIGACGYIFKPITADTLIPQLEAAYHKFAQRDAGKGETHELG